MDHIFNSKIKKLLGRRVGSEIYQFSMVKKQSDILEGNMFQVFAPSPTTYILVHTTEIWLKTGYNSQMV